MHIEENRFHPIQNILMIDILQLKLIYVKNTIKKKMKKRKIKYFKNGGEQDKIVIYL